MSVDAAAHPIPLPAEPLAAGDVRVRPFTLADVPRVHEACQDAAIARWTSIPQPYVEESASGWIAMHDELRARGREAPFAAVDAETDDLLGSVGFARFDWDQHIGEIGYWVAPWARGRGVAATAARVVAHWGLRDLGLHRIEIWADPENVGSCRAAVNAGATFEGVLRQARFAPRSATDRRDYAVHSILRAELD